MILDKLQHFNSNLLFCVKVILDLKKFFIKIFLILRNYFLRNPKLIFYETRN